MKRSLFLLLLVLATPAFAITIKTLDLNEVDDDRIEITAPVWDGSKAGPVLAGTFESKFDRKVASKLAGGFRNAAVPSYDLAPRWISDRSSPRPCARKGPSSAWP
jgi:hypothetical protein